MATIQGQIQQVRVFGFNYRIVLELPNGHTKSFDVRFDDPRCDRVLAVALLGLDSQGRVDIEFNEDWNNDRSFESIFLYRA